MNKFSFHPVGQGLFYTGSILNGYYNFIYDCGKSINDKEFIEIVDKYTNHIQDIDFIVISHLHNDHFNGLPNLIDLCRTKKIKIKKIILPYLYGFKNVAHLLLALSIYEEENLDIKDSNQLYELMCEFYNSERNNKYEILVEFIKNDEEVSEFIWAFPSIEKLLWKFHFLNKKISYNLCVQLNDEIQDLLNTYNMYDLTDFINEYKKIALAEIKKIYENILLRVKLYTLNDGFNDLNASSIVMIHYPINEISNTFFTNTYFNYYKYYKENMYLCCRNKYINMIKNTFVSLSVLTGDAQFDDYMVNYIKNLIENRHALLQVPHHGSKFNYMALSSLFIYFDYYAISFGLGNSYNHPSSETIDCILKNNKRSTIYEVNQLTGLYYYIN